MTIQPIGTVTIASPWFSRIWQFRTGAGTIAQARRNVAQRTSTIELPDGREWLVIPDGWGRFKLTEDRTILGSAERQDLLGRHWQLQGERFSYQLESESMIRRRWTLGPIGSPFAELRGGWISFNRMVLSSGLPIPTEAVVLAWQAIVRPWEAAAAGIGPVLAPE